MSAVVHLRDLPVGDGRVKVAAPMVSTGPEALLEEADRLLAASVDIAEWRADYLLEAHPEAPLTALPAALRARLGTTPLLLTVRSAEEGGRARLSEDEYATTVAGLLQAGGGDAVDVELARAGVLPDLVARAHDAGLPVVLSHHDVAGTPTAEEITDRLAAMAAAGADIAKVAVTAHGARDVLTLLEATVVAREQLTLPVVTMAMGPAGLVSRLCGEVFGSAVTFGAVDQPSAPGQIDVAALRSVVAVVHEHAGGGQ